MIRNRIIPCLLLQGKGIVKTVRFKYDKYIGDPINIVKIFNEKEVDEIIILDIGATAKKKGPQFQLISEIASECFMPLGYGGGIISIEDIKKTFEIGIEKVVINYGAHKSPSLVEKAAKLFGSQSIVVSVDVKKSIFGNYEVYTSGRKMRTGKNPIEYATMMEGLGAGELLINSINRDGTMEGYDLELIKMVTEATSIPVIACGGAGKLNDFKGGISKGGASAVAGGSIFIYQGEGKAVLISYPSQEDIVEIYN